MRMKCILGCLVVMLSVNIYAEDIEAKATRRAAAVDAKTSKKNLELEYKAIDKNTPCAAVQRAEIKARIKTASVIIDAGKSSLRARFGKAFGICPPYPVTQAPVFDPPTTQPPVDFPPVTVPAEPHSPGEPPTSTIADAVKIGEIDPANPLSLADRAIIDSIVHGSKATDDRRGRFLFAGDNYPGTASSLDYCVFDTSVRHLLGFVKKFGFNPADMRTLQNEEYSRANIIKYVDWVFADIKPGDPRVICLSSHGTKGIGPDGAAQGMVVTHDMISTGQWNATTQIFLEYWKEKCKSVPAGCNVTLVFDLCYAGADIRALVGSLKKNRSVDGPEATQLAVDMAKVRTQMRDVNVYNVQFIPMCLDSELSEEGPSTGGGGSWGLWTAIDTNGIDAACTIQIRSANAVMKQRGFSQHVSILGRNAKAPLTKAVPVQ